MSTRSRSDGEVLLIRHGETDWSLTGRHTGNTDLPLTARGELEARALAPLLANRQFDLVLVSPLKRAQRTCDLAGLARDMSIEPDLREWDYGAYEGLTSDEIHRDVPDWLVFRDGCPQGESPEQVGVRAPYLLINLTFSSLYWLDCYGIGGVVGQSTRFEDSLPTELVQVVDGMEHKSPAGVCKGCLQPVSSLSGCQASSRRSC